MDYEQQQLFVYDLDARANLGEVAYARGCTEHPDYFTVPQMAATVHAVRNTGVPMSPSEPSSSDDEHTADYPDEGPVHGFSPETSDSEEQDPGPREGQRRNSSTRFDFLGEMVQAPPQQAIKPSVPPTASTSPPHQSASTPDNSPLHMEMRSSRVKQGAPKKRGRGTKGRR